MCGIAGWFGTGPLDRAKLAADIQELLAHRGPDSHGFESGEDWGLIFRRLSILDLSELGSQPMASPCGQYQLVFNGEIYNYVELRSDLESRGERFTGQSDSEVLLRLLMLEGVDCLSKLNGMFGLAFLDLKARRFILARDRLGQKPLYFRRDAQGLRFASELKGLLAWPDAERSIDPISLVQYLGLMYLPSDRCILAGYEKLAPAHYMVGSLDRPAAGRIERYWAVDVNGDEGPDEFTDEQSAELLELLGDATRIRLRSDVPVGIFLSGGIDSGLVASLAAREGNTERLLALTVGYSEHEYDESEAARSVADRAGLRHQIVHMGPASLDQVDHVAWYFDEPFADPSALPTMALCRAAGDHATVFLAGDGGDEAFGGYSRYLLTQKYARVMGLARPISPGLRAASRLMPLLSTYRYQLAKLGLPQQRMAAGFDQIPNDPVLRTVLSEDYQEYASRAGDPVWERWASHRRSDTLIARQQALDYSLYLPDDVLVKVDRASMASSIEVRSPFLDYRVVEWAATLPRASLTRDGVGKIPLRNVASSMLPATVLDAGKRGFGVPLNEWFLSPEGAALVQERLLGDQSPVGDILSAAGVQAVLDSHGSAGGRKFGSWLWRLLILDSWARNYLSTAPPSRPAASVG